MNISSSYYTTALRNQYAKLQDAQAKAQNEIATGKKFVTSSDAPDTALATQRTSLERLNMSGDESRRNLALRLSESTSLASGQAKAMLEDITNTIQLAYEKDFDSNANAGLGGQIDTLLEQAVSFLNIKQDGRYLFGGNETSQEPFVIGRDAQGAITSVQYQGGSEGLAFDVGLGLRMDPTADPRKNLDWETWMTELANAKTEFVAGDKTASQTALDAAQVAADNSFASITDVVGKALRLQTIEEWSSQKDTQLANLEASLQEIDLNEAILSFNKLQLSYQASLQSGQLLMSLSLVNFL